MHSNGTKPLAQRFITSNETTLPWRSPNFPFHFRQHYQQGESMMTSLRPCKSNWDWWSHPVVWIYEWHRYHQYLLQWWWASLVVLIGSRLLLSFVSLLDVRSFCFSLVCFMMSCPRVRKKDWWSEVDRMMIVREKNFIGVPIWDVFHFTRHQADEGTCQGGLNISPPVILGWGREDQITPPHLKEKNSIFLRQQGFLFIHFEFQRMKHQICLAFDRWLF